ncbi:hypothetical protein APK16_08 [Acinetobacter phage APK16]|uniref:Uncharacterized protein n=2 Tax=Friunavirus TaxID=1985711 RepID=A0AAE8XKN5_9CAUD|nr:hypothetical protein APK16_08 [Acinetobacter phage APK16]UAW09874.1 hypothetical protein APK77_08 [Acinetobacter phage APK77]
MSILEWLFVIHYFIGAALCFSILAIPIANKWKCIILFYFILAIPVLSWLSESKLR